MAEIVLGAFLTVAIEKLASVVALKKFASSMGITDLNKLNASLTSIQSLLNDASQKEQTNESVKGWLNHLQDLAYDIDDFLDALATEAMQPELQEQSRNITSKVRKIIPTCCTNFLQSTGMRPKLDDINTRLQNLENQALGIGLIVKDEKPKKTTNRKYESCFPEAEGIVGREDEKKELLHKLIGDEASSCKKKFSIVPIVGMGGMGKTTLARLLYNDEKVNDHFQLKAWVCVSDEFDIFSISKVIYQHVAGGIKEFQDLSLLHVALGEKLKGQRFLIVLDDVWSENYGDWETLERPFHSGAAGSKVIITTRKDELLKKLGCKQLDRLEILSSDDALTLLARHALGTDNFDSHPALKAYGVGIVKKCNSLPLAIKVLGRLLRKDGNEEHWKGVLNSEIWNSDIRDKSILLSLKLSYLDLAADLKRMFAYCSLFPKDYLFDREELVLLWMAEGFLHQSSSDKSIEQWGHECFDELLSGSFFQLAPNEESLYVMHDLMNDLAMSVAGDFFSRRDIAMKKGFMKDALKKYRHMSFVCEDYFTCEKLKVFEEASKLRSFLALSSKNGSWREFFVLNTILDNLLCKLPLLRVLSLGYLSISELPESIGCLKYLRYLNLSRTKIRHLPEQVCSLYHLQTLIVCGCYYLQELPKSFLKLKNLRHFDIRDTELLNKMPIGIGELKSLRILVSTITIEGDYVFAVPGLNELTDLQQKLSIKGLEKVQNPVHAQEVNLSKKRISELELRWYHAFNGSQMESIEKEVLHVLKPSNDSLKMLVIRRYGGLEFPRWVGDPSFRLLADIRIDGCKKCTSLPPFGQLPSLKKLHITHMDELEVWSTNTHIPCLEDLCMEDCPKLVEVSVEALPSLKKLYIKNMAGLEVWSTNTHIPCLEELRLEDCPKLVEVSVEALPSLRVLEVSNCSEVVLRSLVQSASSSVTNLEISKISGLTDEVWGGVTEHLGAVEEVSISYCNEIRYLWESEAEASKVLVKLRKLSVHDCSNLVRLGEKEEESGSNLLQTSIEIYGCKNMERCDCPNGIEYLSIEKCDSITSVSFPTRGVGGQKLKSLYISGCNKLEWGVKKASLLINNTTKAMRLLEILSISYMENLESIIDLRSFIFLNQLVIQHCPNIKSIPDCELQNLSFLEYMIVTDCPSLDVSFPRGLWPPYLRELHIGGLKKPISEWGPQNFPASLLDLWLHGGSSSLEEMVLNINLGEMSLTSLRIEHFEKLESVSMESQHLTSLQHLSISNCPKMKDLPEPKFLMHSLLSLRINGCPILKERCSGTDSDYWSLISRIPSTNIW